MPLAEVVFRRAVESARTGIVVCDGAGTILFANHQIEARFGFEAAALVGGRIEDLFPGLGDLFSLTVPAGGDVQTGRHKNGAEVPVEIDVTAFERDGGRLFVASVTDISERLLLQHRVEDSKQEHAKFERLVTELAARFVMMRPDHVDEAVVDSLRQICEALDLDRSSWWWTDDSDEPRVSHTWTRPEYRVMQTGDSAAVLVPWTLSRVRKGEIVSFSHVEDIPSAVDRESMARFGTRSSAAIPFFVNGAFHACLGFSAIREPKHWAPEIMERLALVAAVLGQALIRKENEQRLRAALGELQELRDQLAVENVQLRREMKAPAAGRRVVAESPASRWVLEQIESVAPTGATVLLLGETGVGKEVFAHAIHRASDRHSRPMVTVNCAAIPATLIESELFGRERGAYTGALARQIGRFEMAHDSTIFLDEVGELPLEAQVKLLRVLQDKVIERLGGGQPIKVNVRIIAATNRDLEKAVAERAFREDLFYRLNVFPIRIPPLRERLEDLPALVWEFIEEYATEFGKPIESIAKDSLAALPRYSWPGNVRELRNTIEKAVILANGPRLTIDTPAPVSNLTRSTRLDDVEAEQIQKVLESVNWRVRGPGGAAELLGIKPNTLDSRMARLGIRRPSANGRLGIS